MTRVRLAECVCGGYHVSVTTKFPEFGHQSRDGVGEHGIQPWFWDVQTHPVEEQMGAN